MKSTILLLFFALVSSAVFAQNGISFQGIARDPQGNAIAGQTISVKFTIGTFTETQNIDTDNFGVFSATIGSVNTSDFNNLEFANIDENLEVEVDGTIIYDDKFNYVPYAKAAENGVPPGSVMPFAGAANNIPNGWLLCDGTSYAKTGMYGALYSAIGTLWGDDGGNFKVPDLRGLFLRGTNEGRTGTYADPSTRDVGSLQQDAYKNHNHSGSSASAGSHNHSIVYDRGGGGSYGGGYMATIPDFGNFIGNDKDYTSSAGSHTHTITVNTSTSGSSESRPNNAAVVYIIKY